VYGNLPDGITGVSPHVSPLMSPPCPGATLENGFAYTSAWTAFIPGCSRHATRLSAHGNGQFLI